MTRSIVTGLLGVISIGLLATIPLACSSGGVGDPCTPEDEYDPQFAGFKITEENIESRSFQCLTRICLVNHFQGRVTCPLGQEDKASCTPDPNGGAGSCTGAGENCVPATSTVPSCDPTKSDMGAADCNNFGGSCNKQGKFCQCLENSGCVSDDPNHPFFCDAASHQCKTFVCHVPNSCQLADASDDKNRITGTSTPKDCCLPGSDDPVAVPVCGGCEGTQGATSSRSAAQSVYCSCRCGVADGDPEDPNFNFCSCPSGFSCAQIRPNVGLGDPQITGKYCIKDGSDYVQGSESAQCGTVGGVLPDESECSGIQQ